MGSDPSDSDTAPDIIHVGGDAGDVSVKLVLYAQEIDLDAVTAVIGHPSSEAQRRGDPIGHRKKRPAPIGLWSLSAPERLGFTEQVAYLLAQTTADQAAWDKLASAHDIQLRCAVYLHSWNEAISLVASQLQDIGRRHWSLQLSLYSTEGEEVFDAFLRPARERLPDH